MDAGQSLENLNSKNTFYSSMVAVPYGQKQINDLPIGDTVLAYSAKLESDKIKLTSTEAKVTYSGSINLPRVVTTMITISFYSHSFRYILCSKEQPFLLIDGTYTTAIDLKPGKKLVNSHGNPVEIEFISYVEIRTGMHNISTNAEGRGPNGHLILINDIIAGDYIFQTYFKHFLNE